jgi:3-deoxy-manno-octulosonate cytidylyltransferase (CMP-KDO synthetase)
MATLRRKIDDEKEIHDPNIAKLIINNKQDAIYFSRNMIPYNRDNSKVVYYKHIGIYGYKRDFLFKFVALPQGVLEKAECLEQLRAIENGYSIRTVETVFQSIGVDLPEHIELVEKKMKKLEN